MLGVATALQLALVEGRALAQQPSAQDQAAAEGLFAEGKRLMAEGNAAAACPKFEESQRLDPAPGTQFKLGECYEQTGRTASAWALFLNVAAAAKSANMPDREQIARERAHALEGKIPKLSIAVPNPVPGIEVKRDGVLVGPGQYGSAVAVDPGSHEIVVTAPGKERWTTKTDVAAAAQATVTVPALVDERPSAGSGAAAQGGADVKPHGLGTQRTLSLVAAGVGVVGIGIGTVFGLKDMSKLDESKGHCVGNACDAVGVGLRDDAVSAGNVSTVAFGVGIVALAGAAVLWFTAPRGASSGQNRGPIAPSIGIGPRGAIVGGTF